MPPTRNFKGEKMTLTVNLGDASYDIVLERGCLDRAAEHLDLCRRVLVVTDAGVPKAYAERLAAQCRAPRIVTVPEGESSKSVEGWALLLREMLDGGFSRGDCVVAVGGGVVGDLAGFAASALVMMVSEPSAAYTVNVTSAFTFTRGVVTPFAS